MTSTAVPTFLGPLLDRCAAGWGASTGYMARERGDWDRLLDTAAGVSGDVVELSALSGPELGPLARALGDPARLEGFRFTSVHAPAKGWRASASDLVEVLTSLPPRIAGFVVHPETLPELRPFTALGARLWLENMDRRKDDARTVPELERYFADLPEARFCFDIAHAWQHDPSMSLAHALLEAFGDRLAEVHLSSILPDGTHVPVTEADADAFAPVLERCGHVPWVLEAPLPGD